ncbi:MAG: hypothetical protein DBY22_00600 [Clostridiales bacterium]|nr:MAG: hypothetical protein DBY22_00600 [Clostridiales bacterium]
MTIVLIIILIISLFLYFRYRKIPRLGNMVLVTGGIKTGKSTLSVYLALRTYKKQLFKWKIKCFIGKFLKVLKIPKFKNFEKPEKPLFYSNIPLKMPYVPLTKELLLREERFAYGSVCYICEASLVADSMSYKDMTLNENLLLLNKLFAHETKGGYIFYDTQSILDNHYAVKRCLSSYLYIHHTIKTIPFFLLCWVREMKFSEDNTIVNSFDSDVEKELKLIILPKKIWKKFDCYCYSSFTDDLPVNDNLDYPETLKADDIISFKTYFNLKRGGKK